MKTHNKVLSLLAIIAISILGCSKSDPAPTQAQLLVGSWKQTSYVRSGCTDASLNEAPSVCTTNCPTITITATTITLNNPGSAPETLTYTVSGATLSTVPPMTETITFLVSGNTLTINSKMPASGSEANCLGVSTFTRI